MQARFKSVDELTFTDDGMFQAVLSDPDICSELLERLLKIKVGRVEYPELEKQIAPYYSSKGVRLDVFVKGSDKIIDVEMQSWPQRALGKRMRYYQSMMDMDALMKGEDYESLKESWVLFICKSDPFIDKNGRAFGLPRYTFKNVCSENPSVNLNDKSLKVVYNSSAYAAEKDEKVRAFLRFALTNEPGRDEFSKRLRSIVEKKKENEKFRSYFAAMNLHDRDLIKAAKNEQALEAARNFLANGVSEEIVARSLGLPLDEVKSLSPRAREQN